MKIIQINTVNDLARIINTNATSLYNGIKRNKKAIKFLFMAGFLGWCLHQKEINELYLHQKKLENHLKNVISDGEKCENIDENF